MNRISKYAAAAALTGALALAAATPSQARWYGHHGWHNGAGAAIGFGVGALAGAAIASGAYDNGYYGYDYAPGYAYEPAPYDSYAYAPAYNSYRNDGAPACAGSLGYGRPDYSSC
jgi:hypothetical protein